MNDTEESQQAPSKLKVFNNLCLSYIFDFLYLAIIAFILFMIVPLVFTSLTLSFVSYVISLILLQIVYTFVKYSTFNSIINNLFNFIVLIIIYNLI